MNIKSKQPDILAIPSPCGGVFTSEGLGNQSFFLRPDQVAHFLQEPSKSHVIVVPPMAGLALTCYLSAIQLTSFDFEQDLTVSPYLSVIAHTRSGAKVGYFSDPSLVPTEGWMRKQSLSVAVTPNGTAVIRTKKRRPKFEVIIQHAVPERPDRQHRFAADPEYIRDVVEAAIRDAKIPRTHAR